MRRVSQLVPLVAAATLWTSAATASTITLTFDDTYLEQRGISLGGGTFFEFDLPTQPTVLTVPKFDPSLGTLVGARLVLSGGLTTRMVNHAALATPGFVSTTATADVTARLLADATLASLLGTTTVAMSVDFGTRTLTDSSINPFDQPFVEQVRILEDNFDFDHTYTGAALASFIAGHPFEVLSLRKAPTMISFSGEHSGFPSNALLAINDDPDDLFDDGHGLIGYSHFHLTAGTLMELQVEYTYETKPAALPEPATMLMVASGVAAWRWRGKRRT